MKFGKLGSKSIKKGFIEIPLDKAVGNFINLKVEEGDVESIPNIDLISKSANIQEGVIFLKSGYHTIYKFGMKKVSQYPVDFESVLLSKENKYYIKQIWSKERYEFYLPETYFIFGGTSIGNFRLIFDDSIFYPMLNIFNEDRLNNSDYEIIEALKRVGNIPNARHIRKACSGQTYKNSGIGTREFYDEIGRGVNLFISAQSNLDLFPNPDIRDWGFRSSLSVHLQYCMLSYLSSIYDQDKFLEFLSWVNVSAKTQARMLRTTIKEKKAEGVDKRLLKKIENYFVDVLDISRYEEKLETFEG